MVEPRLEFRPSGFRVRALNLFIDTGVQGGGSSNYATRPLPSHSWIGAHPDTVVNSMVSWPGPGQAGG